MGDVTVTGEVPFPNETNGWDETKTKTLTVGAGDFKNGTFKIILVKIGGGDGVTRGDRAIINGDEKDNQTNTFNGDCPNYDGDIDPGTLLTFDIPGPGTYTFEIRHIVTLSETGYVVAVTHSDVIK